jgi:hypothetical protein
VEGSLLTDVGDGVVHVDVGHGRHGRTGGGDEGRGRGEREPTARRKTCERRRGKGKKERKREFDDCDLRNSANIIIIIIC